VPTAYLRATLESGTTWNDPSEDLLFELLTDLEHGPDTFFIIERVDDPSGQTYAQVLRTDDGRYIVEHRDGGPQHHRQAITPDIPAAHRALTGWCFGLDGWQDGLTWSVPAELT
jgi:hypothetical protein